jgi:hypothetical protein
MCGTKIGREDKQNTEKYSMGYKNSYKQIFIAVKRERPSFHTTYT